MSNTSLDISVIIPAYNCAKSIDNALESVFAQSAIPREVIIVDDGSTDDTQQVIKKSKYAQLVTYVRQENAGPSRARNHAISLASSTWIAFLDADDLWVHQDKLRMQMELIDKHAEVVLVDSFATVDWHGEKEITISRLKKGKVFKQFLYSNVINATSSVLAKRTIVNEIGGFVDDLRFGEDRLLWAQLAKAGEVQTLPVVTVRKFNEEGNLTSRGDKNYRHRIDLVQRLLNLAQVSDDEVADIWFENVKDFLKLSFKVNDTSSFLKVFTDTTKHSKKQLWFSRYGVLALYAKTFQSFKPLV